jgi:hypothetical protein
MKQTNLIKAITSPPKIEPDFPVGSNPIKFSAAYE